MKKQSIVPKHISVKVTVTAECPYCKIKQGQLVTQGFNVLFCLPEEGGCGKYFVVDMWFEAKMTTFEMVEVIE